MQGHEFLLRLLGRFESVIQLRDVILTLYCECRDQPLVPYAELTDQEKLKIAVWIQEYLEAEGIYEQFRKMLRERGWYIDIMEKIRLPHGSMFCTACAIGYQSKKSLEMTIEPISENTDWDKEKKKYWKSIAAFVSKHYFQPIVKSLCVRVVLNLDTTPRQKDLDTMAKVFIDALQEVVIHYEKHVDHLAMYRFYNDEGENSVMVYFGYSKLNSEHTILFPVVNHGELKQQRGQYTVHT